MTVIQSLAAGNLVVDLFNQFIEQKNPPKMGGDLLTLEFGLGCYGAGDGARTHDLKLGKLAL